MQQEGCVLEICQEMLAGNLGRCKLLFNGNPQWAEKFLTQLITYRTNTQWDKYKNSDEYTQACKEETPDYKEEDTFSDEVIQKVQENYTDLKKIELLDNKWVVTNPEFYQKFSNNEITEEERNLAINALFPNIN